MVIMSDTTPPKVVDDDDDDMADLFSFAAGPEGGDAPILESSGSEQTHPRERTGSDDSLLNMLASETPVFSTTSTLTTTTTDKESQEILDWLNDDDKKMSEEKVEGLSPKETTPPEDTTTQQDEQEQPAKPEPELEPTVVALPPVFESFHQALHSSQSTNVQIRDLYAKECESQQILLSPMDRQQVYCRIILNKASVQEATDSSLAHSFDEWKPSAQEDSTRSSWVEEQASVWSERVATLTGRSSQECSADLTKLLQYYFANKNGSTPKDDGSVGEETHPEMDPLLPAVAATILATKLPVAAASVVLGQFIPTYMPLIAMESQERWEAALSLYTDFYRLACYHLPFLVYHLDQYLPGWHWPRIPVQQSKDKSSATVLSRNLQKRGQLPPSWLLAHFCGECSDGNKCNLPAGILELWDRTLLLHANEMRFFLALVMLQDAADDLLLLTDSALIQKLQDVLRVKENINVQQWWSKAQFLQSRTPESVIRHLDQSEDKAVQEALRRRQERAEEALQARLQAQAEAHRLEQEKKAEEARDRLTRARLVAFYRKHAPDKETNIDILMEKYKGRYEELDAKVKKKYGEGFNPAVAKSSAPKQPNKEANPKGPNKLLATMNQGLGRGRKEQAGNIDESDSKDVKADQVSVMVSPEDVLPVICWSREAAAVRGAARRHSRQSHRKMLKFYLVDSRSEEAAQEQGRFPTAVSLSPEAMLDPERIRQNENMFESLRGAVHIVVMGEGFSALPNLYTHKMSSGLDELAREDDSRTNICALFFIKKGFPFVSVLEGGFAAAHSWLVREGPKHHLSASSVLVDYDPENSLFGQMETYHNASGKEKAQRTMQKMLENSLVSMTRSAQRLEKLASDMEQGDGSQGLARINIFRRGKSLDTKADSGKMTEPRDYKIGEENRPAFKNPIAMLRRQYSDDRDETSKSPFQEDGDQPDAITNSEENKETPPKREVSAAEPSRPGPKAEKKEQGDTKPMNNPFKGFGAAFNNTVKVANSNNTNTGTTDAQSDVNPTQAVGVPNVLKRNPFARFGGGGSKQQQPQAAPPEKKQPSATATAARGLAGLNQFRKSTMARMRQNNTDSALQQEEEEEAIAFGATEDDAALDLSLQQEEESPSANVKQI